MATLNRPYRPDDPYAGTTALGRALNACTPKQRAAVTRALGMDSGSLRRYVERVHKGTFAPWCRRTLADILGAREHELWPASEDHFIPARPLVSGHRH